MHSKVVSIRTLARSLNTPFLLVGAEKSTPVPFFLLVTVFILLPLLPALAQHDNEQQDVSDIPYRLIPGYRIQVAAVESEEEANRITSRFSKWRDVTPHVAYRDGLYKIQIGDFTEYDSAKVINERVHLAGYRDSWVTRSKILSSKREVFPPQVTVDTEPDRLPLLTKRPQGPGTSEGWRIQVMSLANSSAKASEREAQAIATTTGLNAYVQGVQGAYKILLGDFATRDDAAKELTHVIEAGYEDAFPTRSLVFVSGK